MKTGYEVQRRNSNHHWHRFHLVHGTIPGRNFYTLAGARQAIDARLIASDISLRIVRMPHGEVVWTRISSSQPVNSRGSGVYYVLEYLSGNGTWVRPQSNPPLATEDEAWKSAHARSANVTWRVVKLVEEIIEPPLPRDYPIPHPDLHAVWRREGNDIVITLDCGDTFRFNMVSFYEAWRREPA